MSIEWKTCPTFGQLKRFLTSRGLEVTEEEVLESNYDRLVDRVNAIYRQELANVNGQVRLLSSVPSMNR